MSTGAVVVVDDDVNTRIIAETLLRAHGLAVFSVPPGRESREALIHDDDVVLVDAALSTPGGASELRQLREQIAPLPFDERPRIVVLSDKATRHEPCRSIDENADEVLDTAQTSRRLIATVDRIMADRKHHDSGSADS